MLSRWEKGTERTLVSTKVLELKSVQFHHLGKAAERDFTVIHVPDWVNVVAVTPQRQIVLVRQFRFGSDDFSLELPGGVIESGEDPVAAGLRELQEETGFGGGAVRLLGKVKPNPAIMDNHCHYVLVEGAVPNGPMNWDSDEEIEVETAPVATVLAWARTGVISHSLSVAALMFFEGTLPR
jgi:8-oxo-dGTP pyrophosphatase MutT (NUDIX family)